MQPLAEAALEQISWIPEAQRGELSPAAALCPRLRELLGDAGPGPAKDSLAATARLLELALAGQPQLFLVDDLHAADELSLEFLELLARWPAALPLVVLAAFRGGEPIDAR